MMSPRIAHNFSLNDALPNSVFHLILRLILGLYIMAYDTELAQADTALGNDNPTLAYNLDTFADHAPVSQFLNVVKHMRRWEGNLEGNSGKIDYETLQEGGYLDKDGWVKEFPEGMSSVTGFWQWKKSLQLGYGRGRQRYLCAPI